MNTEQMRKEFEVWAEEYGHNIERYPGVPLMYLEDDTAYGWAAWQAALAAQPQAPQGSEWLPIETAPKVFGDGAKPMFVVCAFNVRNGFTGGKPYTTDPYCVWAQKDGGYMRWPHKFSPTHWQPLPAAPKTETPEGDKQ